MGTDRIAIIVLNWNGWRDTVECLESLSRITYKNFKVIVVDNGSTDGSVPKIKDWASGKLPVQSKYFTYDPNNKPFPLDIIELGKNLGFSKGNNAGIRAALNDPNIEYVLTLNNDIVVDPDFLGELLKGFKSGDRVALAGPKILDYGAKRYFQSPMRNRLNLLKYLLFLTPLFRVFSATPFYRSYIVEDRMPTKVYQISGCAMMFSAAAIKEIGFFDESSFLYWEEFIVAEKLLSRSYGTCFVPSSVIYHKIAASTNKIDPAEKTLIMLRAENYFQRKYFKMPSIERAVVRALKALIYVVFAAFSAQYRANLGELLRIIFSGSEGMA